MKLVSLKNFLCMACLYMVVAGYCQGPVAVGEVGALKVSDFVEKVVLLTNEVRTRHGLQTLRVSPKLCEVANWLAEDMAQHGYFDHTDRHLRKLGKRLQDFGYKFQLAGENIAAGQLTPEMVVEGWMNSPGHRANILRTDFREIGIGYSPNGKGYYRDYWVQNFGVPFAGN